MKNFVRASCIALTAVFATACSTPPAPQGPSEEELIAAADELDRQFIEAYNKGDTEALLSLYWNSPDLGVYPPGDMQLMGYEKVKASFGEAFAKESGATLTLHDSRNTVFGNVVLGQGLWTWSMPVPGHDPYAGEGRYTDLKVMIDGKMVYVCDHASAPMAPDPELMKLFEAPADSAATAEAG